MIGIKLYQYFGDQSPNITKINRIEQIKKERDTGTRTTKARDFP